MQPVPAEPLDLLPSRSISVEQREMLQAIEAADLWYVQERLEQKHGLLPDRARQAIQEFKRYMALVGLGYRGLGMISPTVDEVWHGFILFTREYAGFCQSAFGEFIHHVPRTSREPRSKDGAKQFALAYEEVFGPLPEIWRERLRTGEADNDPSGCGTEDCKGD
jgi:hypothetical protein